MTQKNTLHPQDEAVFSSNNDSRIKELEKQLTQKDIQIKNIKKNDDIAPGIRKTYEFTAAFKNGYSDGIVTKEKEKLIAEEFTKRHRQ